MLGKIKDSFRRVSWWGFTSFLLVIVAAVAFTFFAGTFQLAVVLVLLAIWAMLASFRDE